jgi:hypothetical protein
MDSWKTGKIIPDSHSINHSKFEDIVFKDIKEMHKEAGVGVIPKQKKYRLKKQKENNYTKLDKFSCGKLGILPNW